MILIDLKFFKLGKRKYFSAVCSKNRKFQSANVNQSLQVKGYFNCYYLSQNKSMVVHNKGPNTNYITRQLYIVLINQ